MPYECRGDEVQRYSGTGRCLKKDVPQRAANKASAAHENLWRQLNFEAVPGPSSSGSAQRASLGPAPGSVPRPPCAASGNIRREARALLSCPAVGWPAPGSAVSPRPLAGQGVQQECTSAGWITHAGRRPSRGTGRPSRPPLPAGRGPARSASRPRSGRAARARAPPPSPSP